MNSLFCRRFQRSYSSLVAGLRAISGSGLSGLWRMDGLGEVARKPAFHATHSRHQRRARGCHRLIGTLPLPATNVGSSRPRLPLLLAAVRAAAVNCCLLGLVGQLDESVEPTLAPVRNGELLPDVQRHWHHVAGEDGPRHRAPAAQRHALAADAEQRAARERPGTCERHPRARHAELLAAQHLLALLLQLLDLYSHTHEYRCVRLRGSEYISRLHWN